MTIRIKGMYNTSSPSLHFCKNHLALAWRRLPRRLARRRGGLVLQGPSAARSCVVGLVFLSRRRVRIPREHMRILVSDVRGMVLLLAVASQNPVAGGVERRREGWCDGEALWRRAPLVTVNHCPRANLLLNHHLLPCTDPLPPAPLSFTDSELRFTGSPTWRPASQEYGGGSCLRRIWPWRNEYGLGCSGPQRIQQGESRLLCLSHEL